MSPEVWDGSPRWTTPTRPGSTEAVEPELAAARSGDRARAEQLVASGDGKRLFDEVRARTGRRRGDRRRAARATQRADALLRRLSFLLAFTIVAFLATVLLGAGAFSRTCCARSPSSAAAAGRWPAASSSTRCSAPGRGRSPRWGRTSTRCGDTCSTSSTRPAAPPRRWCSASPPSARCSRRSPSCRRSATASRSAPRSSRPRACSPATSSTSSTSATAGSRSSSATCPGTGRRRRSSGLRLKSALSAMLRQAAVPDVLAAVRDGLVGESELFATVFVAVIDTAARPAATSTPATRRRCWCDGGPSSSSRPVRWSAAC